MTQKGLPADVSHQAICCRSACSTKCRGFLLLAVSSCMLLSIAVRFNCRQMNSKFCIVVLYLSMLTGGIRRGYTYFRHRRLQGQDLLKQPFVDGPPMPSPTTEHAVCSIGITACTQLLFLICFACMPMAVDSSDWHYYEQLLCL